MDTIAEFPGLVALQEVAAKRTDAVVLVDLVAKEVIFSNERASKLLGINSKDNLTKVATLITFVAPADREYIRNKSKQVTHNSSVSGIEFRLVNSSGDTLWLSAETVTIENNRFLYAIIRDITHAKDHEDYLIQYGARKNTVLDTIIHQLSGSLNLMKNLASKASQLSALTNQPVLENFISLMSDNSKHCIKIIDDLVKVEYNQSPGIHVKLSRFDIVKSVAYIFEEFKKNGNSRKLIFDSSIPVLFISTDDFKLLQIINNLASNALKFTLDGDEIKFSIRESDATVLISISDTGIGIPQALQPFLFEKQGPAGRTGLNGETSNGLGLSICYHLTQMIGGRLWFKSQEGIGSTFYIELPKD